MSTPKLPSESDTGAFPGSAAVDPECKRMADRIAAIDDMFAEATAWGSWMVECANERERLVNRLHGYGVEIFEHKHLARTASGGRVD